MISLCILLSSRQDNAILQISCYCYNSKYKIAFAEYCKCLSLKYFGFKFRIITKIQISRVLAEFSKKNIYSQTCVKQAPMGKPKIGCLRQVLA